MSQTYYAILTAVGEAKLANATALGIPLQVSRMAVGDGAGALPTPVRTQTALAGEQYRADLSLLDIDENNPGQIIAELVIPETIGGWWIREMGLYDVDANLIAVANCPPSYKPQMAEGSGRTQRLRMVLVVSSTAAVQLKIDPSVVLATREWVEQHYLERAPAAQPGQHPVRTATGMAWQYPHQSNAQFKASSTPLAAKAGHAYHLTSNAPVTLPPAAGLAVGDALRFTKSQAVEQVLISVEGTAGETVMHNGKADTSFYLDINAEAVVVWNGGAWEV